jgi:hypothetical protein
MAGTMNAIAAKPPKSLLFKAAVLPVRADTGQREVLRPLCSGLPDWAGAPRACGLDDLSALSRAQVSPVTRSGGLAGGG